MKIIDNLLAKEEFKKLQEAIMNPEFPWYYQDHSTYKGDKISQLTHIFYDFELKQKSNGLSLSLLDPVIRKLNAVGLIRIKANLTFPAKTKEQFHIDYRWKHLLTAIYYINTNNGGTRFKNKFVEAKENRAVIMPCNTLHAVVRHTNGNFGRFVINFNYFTGEGSGKGYVQK